jgi:hypothetical protein
VPALEAALAEQLLPRQRELLARAAALALQALRQGASRRLNERRRHVTEQMLELRGLRGKSNAKVQAMLLRLDAEMGDFERCSARLSALRAVHQRQLQKALTALSSDVLRNEVEAMRQAMAATPLHLGARKAFVALCQRLRAALDSARGQADEIQQMLGGSYQQLNAEFGFAFTLTPAPQLHRFAEELELIERSYGRHLGPMQAWRLSGAAFMEAFQRMLVSKLRVVFENAAGEIELWSKAASTQLEQQLRERRRTFQHRHQALERIRGASGELEQRIAEVEQQDKRLAGLQWRLDSMIEQALAVSQALPAAEAPDEEHAAPLRSSAH